MGESGPRYTPSVVAQSFGIFLILASPLYRLYSVLFWGYMDTDADIWIPVGVILFCFGRWGGKMSSWFKDRKLRKTQSGAGSLQRRPLSGGGIAVMLVVIIGFIVVVIMAGTASTAEEAGIARISKAILALFLVVLMLFGGLRNREEVGQEKEDGNSENTPMSGNSPEVGGNFCENCGNALSPDTNYCSKCGTRRAL